VPIIGTAGHVDHGKTALIAALTGFDTDRLPEEIERGMTTDLGFAHFRDDSGRPVGMIDVPGHERYIRNMVAGAWGLDGALLAVAADDGWMEQTGRHVQVLDALGVPVLAIALTKVDLAGPDAALAAGREALARLGGSGPGRLAPRVFPVSAPRGEGIAELRAGLLEALVRLTRDTASADSAAAEVPVTAAAFFYIDRIFPLKGTGLVVAGSLRGGNLRSSDELVLLPEGEKLKLRAMQVYGEPTALALEGTRLAIAVARPKATLRRGDCVAANAVGAAGPSTVVQAAVLAAGPARITTCRALYARLEAPFPAAGSSLPGKAFGAAAPTAPRFRQGTELELAAGTASRITAIHPRGDPGGAWLSLSEDIPVYPGQPIVIIRRGGADILAKGRIEAVGGAGAAERRRIERALGISSARDRPANEAAPRVAVAAPRVAVAAEGQATNAAGAAAAIDKAGAILRDAAEAGLDLEARPVPGLRAPLSILCSRGQAIGFGQGLYMDAERYATYVRRILAGRAAGSRFSVPAAKEAAGLSRKWILPILNRMQDEGLVRRDGDEREVLSRTPRPPIPAPRSTGP